MSHVVEIQQADAKAETRLLKLLDKDTDWLYELRYTYGLAWLKVRFGFDPKLESALATMPGPQGAARNLFWGWWLNDWQHRDTVMSAQLVPLKDGTASYGRGGGVITIVHSRADLLDHYRELHLPKNSQVRLPGFVLDAARSYLRTALPEE